MIFGTFNATSQDVSLAYNHGIRKFDTSSGYGTEGLLSCFNDVVVQSKIWFDKMAPYEIEKYVDYLRYLYNKECLEIVAIHTPKIPRCLDWGKALENASKSLVKLQNRGIVKNIGVSNFKTHHLDIISSTFKPAFNQIECHPAYPQQEIRSHCASAGIPIQAWGITCCGRLLKDPVINAIAKKKACTPMQVVVGWCFSKNIEPVVFSSRNDHLEEILSATPLSEAEVKFASLCHADRSGFDSDYNIEGIFD